MKSLFIFCALCCFIAVLKLPIEYYTFLRTVVSLSSILIIYNFIKYKNYYWIAVFIILFILFNPILPIYLHRKGFWIPLDITAGILFLLLSFLEIKEKVKKEIEISSSPKTYTRDRIILPKAKNNIYGNHN